MKTFLAISALALLAAGCATTADTQVAQSDCKVAPITTASVTGRYRPADRLEQRHAEMQLGTSDYRYRNLDSRGHAMNNVEEALRDCANR